MMTSQASKYHDPMYNFDTHFPERLSRLHLHNDSPASFRKKKSRAQRCGSRYKTQPVTFDEITEVDEGEPSSSTEEKPQGEKLMGQLQAFSRSMDGLLPRDSGSGSNTPPHHISHSRSGSRKFHRHPDCIPERVEAESNAAATSPQPQANPTSQPLFGGFVQPTSGSSSINRVPAPEAAAAAAAKPPRPHSAVEPHSLVSCSINSGGQVGGSSSASSKSTKTATSTTTASAPTTSTTPSPSSPSSTQVSAPADANTGLSQTPLNMAPRRQKVTAKAKKRQKASEEGGQIS